MTKSNSTLIAVVLDRSGSMARLITDVVGGFDSFINAQKKEPGECKITLCQFDDVHEEVWTLQDIATVPSIESFYLPRGQTALNDAVARTIISVGEELKKRPDSDRPANVIFMIVTDGQENASKEFKGASGKIIVREMIKHQTEKYSWKFTYLGANVDAFAEAESFGIKGDAAIKFSSTKKGVAGSYDVMAASVSRSRRRGGDISYSVSERSKAMGEDEDGGDQK